MGQGIIAVRTYVIVCALLILLTVLTVAVSFLPLSGDGHIACGLVIALCKGSLVVLFFMHALISSRVTWTVIVVTGFWLMLLLTLTLIDYYSRDMLPYTPGH